MRQVILTVVLAGTVTVPAWAQSPADRYQEPNEGGRYSAEAQAVPPGYLPAPGTCRIWYDGRPAGHQPPATSCAAAEQVARRERAARVVYGGDRSGPADQTRTAAYEQGFKDGRDVGADDRRGDKRYDPTRHSRYQVAERATDVRAAEQTPGGEVSEYRDGFRAGYAEGYSVRMTRSEN